MAPVSKCPARPLRPSDRPSIRSDTAPNISPSRPHSVRPAAAPPSLEIPTGTAAGSAPPAQGYAELARQLGVEPGSLLISDRALNTTSEAGNIVKVLGEAPFLLVTSAYHMPRAVRAFQSVGAHPIPAPTGQLVNESARRGWRDFLPTPGGLRKTGRALHEYLGLLAFRLGVN